MTRQVAPGLLCYSSRRKGRTIQLAVPLPSSAQRADPARPLIALLVPGGRDHAGGIGRWAGYLHDSWTAQRLLPELELIDTRSTGHAGRAALAFARALIRLGWLHATGRLGTVHANVAKRGSTVRKWIVSILTHNLRIPLVLHLHGSGYDRFFAELPAFWQRRVRIMFGRADRVVVLGQYWADWATETLQIAPERLHILHNGVAMPVRQDRVPGPCRILLLGRLGARKGVPELLTALASPALRERAWTATLAGDGELDRYRRDVDRSGQADRITLPGWLDLTDVASLLAQADILVLPSHAENFPISIIEALAATVAVIATPVGATPELLRDGHSALFVPVGDTAALALALTRLIDHPDLRHAIAAAGHAVFRERLDIDVLAGHLAAIHAPLCAAARHEATC